jgi:hypothetical protein
MTIDVDYTTEHPLRPLTALEKLRLIGEIATTYGRARWWLRSGTVEQAARRARRGGPAGAADQRPVETFVYALRVGQLVERGLRRLPGDTRCLTRSMVLVRLLSRRGIFSTLVIGVRPKPSFAAHAWVELDGRPLLHPSEYAAGRLLEL